MRRGLVLCVCVWASLVPLRAQADIIGGVLRGVTAAPRAVMGGLFGSAHGRHHHRHAVRREAPVSPAATHEPPALSSWSGAVYWPSAYGDTFGYILSAANAAGAFWTHSSDDIYDAVFVPAMASTLLSDKPAPQACAEERHQGVSLEPMQRTLRPTEAQRALIDTLGDALAQASDRVRASCTPASTPASPTARLETMWDRLRALRQAVSLVRTPLKALYDSLSDEQKARINSPPDATPARRGGNVLEPQACAESALRNRAWSAKPIEAAVQPTDQQRASLGALASTTSRLSALLQPSCPQAMLVTPTGRLEAVANRLDSMIYAVTLERAALNAFYASLNDDQKARFDAEIRRAPPQRDHATSP